MEQQLIDDAFHVEQRSYGLWYSTDKDGKGLITSLTEEDCVKATRWYLQQKQENAFDKKEEVTYDSVVGGKL
jgi:hypothetical protein